MSRRSRLLATSLLVAALIVLGTAALSADATPAPTVLPVPVLEGGDLRSDGGGPGLVGNPLLILGAVAALGAGTALVTVVVARLARRT